MKKQGPPYPKNARDPGYYPGPGCEHQVPNLENSPEEKREFLEMRSTSPPKGFRALGWLLKILDFIGLLAYILLMAILVIGAYILIKN